jgi:hypothetical protein
MEVLAIYLVAVGAATVAPVVTGIVTLAVGTVAVAAIFDPELPLQIVNSLHPVAYIIYNISCVIYPNMVGDGPH